MGRAADSRRTAHTRRRRLGAHGLTSTVTAHTPLAANVEVVGSIRRECLDHVIVLNQTHLQRVLTLYSQYYHRSRTHLGLEKDAPHSRLVSVTSTGPVIAIPEVGGLHHRYERRAA